MEVGGGSRSYYDVQGRQAGTLTEAARFKLTGEYRWANDFANHNMYAPISTGGSTSPEVGASSTPTWRAVVARWSTTWTAAGAWSQRGDQPVQRIGITNVGRNQLVN